MVGHDYHSIVAGVNHADAIITQLCGYIWNGYNLILTFHYQPEDLKDVETKISFLENLKTIAAGCSNADSINSEV